MKKAYLMVLVALAFHLPARAQEYGKLENTRLVWEWNFAAGKLSASLENKADHSLLNLNSECFQLVLEDGRTVKASDFKLINGPKLTSLSAQPAASIQSHHSPGQQFSLEFSDERDHLTALWQVNLRDGANYLQQQLTLRATGGDAWLKAVGLFEQPLADAQTIGTVDGSPVVAGTFFCGYEHPMAQNTVAENHLVKCELQRNAVLKDGETLVESFVLGVTAPGQLRRDFQAYIENARAHPYRPFLHYNSWFDIAWDKRKFNEAESLDVINRFGRELSQQRGVQLSSFLFDDGWDDNHTLWNFHDGFPNGFNGVKAAAAQFNANVGVWISPFGGYNEARTMRLEYGVQQGFETNASGFSLAGPKYYQRFHEICLDMIKKYDVNMFKFDGLAAGEKAGETGQTRDGDAMLRLIADLRAEKPDIYINETTGTWPSPFWLLYVDSIWRGGADHDFSGKGTPREQWMTYRDAQTYANVVQRGPLYPLNSLMLHGIILARNADKLDTADDAEFADEVLSFFASGTQLQELYVTPALLKPKNWDDIANAANWARKNADVLVDTHWVGGDPGQGQVYGWAAWSPRKVIFALRNPDDQPATFSMDAPSVFQLPASESKLIHLVRVGGKNQELPGTVLEPGKSQVFTLKPFEVMVWESQPSASSYSESTARSHSPDESPQTSSVRDSSSAPIR